MRTVEFSYSDARVPLSSRYAVLHDIDDTGRRIKGFRAAMRHCATDATFLGVIAAQEALEDARLVPPHRHGDHEYDEYTIACADATVDGKAMWRERRRRCTRRSEPHPDGASAPVSLGVCPSRLGVSIGTGMGALQAQDDACRVLQPEGRGVRGLLPYVIPQLLMNTLPGCVSLMANARGPVSAPATACAAGLQAIIDGVNMIQSGKADVVIVGGSESAFSPVCVGGLWRGGALSRTGALNDADVVDDAAVMASKVEQARIAASTASQPFSAARDGFVMGEVRLFDGRR